MAKQRAPKPKKTAHVFAYGDMVEIPLFGKGKIVELRGNLGPGGAEVYRVMYRRKPTPGYIEVLADQIRPLKAEKKPKAGKSANPPDGTPTAAGG